MKHAAIDLADTLGLFTEHGRPKVIAEWNDGRFEPVQVQDVVVWHRHDDVDEVIVAVDGELGRNSAIELRDGRVDLRSGGWYVVPKGGEHKPPVARACRVMLVEPLRSREHR